LLDAWFPRVVDRDNGGFSCDFDYRWRPSGPNDKMLEFQARTLRFVARAAQFDPDLVPHAKHGFEFLCGSMWDSEFGGWYRMVDAWGKPLQNSVNKWLLLV
jgi:mannobiose 2-epimerase